MNFSGIGRFLFIFFRCLLWIAYFHSNPVYNLKRGGERGCDLRIKFAVLTVRLITSPKKKQEA